MGSEFGLPIITPGAQEAMDIMDRKLQGSQGEVAMGTARWIVGTPPPALILIIRYALETRVRRRNLPTGAGRET